MSTPTLIRLLHCTSNEFGELLLCPRRQVVTALDSLPKGGQPHARRATSPTTIARVRSAPQRCCRPGGRTCWHAYNTIRASLGNAYGTPVWTTGTCLI